MSDHLLPNSASFSRRTVMKTAGITAAVAGVGAGSACAAGGGAGGAQPSATDGAEEKTAENPFGVDKTQPVEVVIFDGGYGDQYGSTHVAMYNTWAGGEVAKMSSTTKIATEMQPRFSGGNPPEVIDNSGADSMPTSQLVAQNQLADLTPLLDAPTIDDPATKIGDYLLPGTESVGSYDGTMRTLNYVFFVWGWWYSSTTFEEKGWKPAKTWDDFLALCDTIKGTGMAPIIHTGVYTYYLGSLLESAAVKKGGIKVAVDIDNLTPDSWNNDSVLAAAKQIQELYDKGFIFAGSEGMDHTTSQTEWLNGRGAMLPCGSWLENEMKGKVPDKFDMMVTPHPSAKGDAMPFEAVFGGSGEPFAIAEQAKNKPGGLEYLRIMLSKDGATEFANQTGSLVAVQGAGDNLTDPSVALQSVADVTRAAGDNIFNVMSTSVPWYSDMKAALGNETAGLTTGRIKAEQFCENMQKAADGVRGDTKIEKFQRPA